MSKILNIIFVVVYIILIYIISLFESKIKTKLKKYILIFSVIILSVFLGFRNIGLDIEAYRSLFNNLRPISISEIINPQIFTNRIEPFFLLLISLMKTIGLDFKMFLFVSGSLPMIIVLRIILKTQESYQVSTYALFLLLNLFTGPIELVRHFFAATIFLSALYALSSNETIKFWIKSLISIFVHYSNSVIIVSKPLLEFKWNTSKYLRSIILTTLCAFSFKLLLSMVPTIDFWSFSNTIIWKLYYYLIYYNEEGYQYTGYLHRILLYIRVSIPFILNLYYIFLSLKNISLAKKNNLFTVLLNSQIIGSLLMIFFTSIGAYTLGMRLNFLFSIGFFLLIKFNLFDSELRNRKYIYLFTIFVLVFYNFITVLYYAGIHDPNSAYYLFF